MPTVRAGGQRVVLLSTSCGGIGYADQAAHAGEQCVLRFVGSDVFAVDAIESREFVIDDSISIDGVSDGLMTFEAYHTFEQSKWYVVTPVINFKNGNHWVGPQYRVRAVKGAVLAAGVGATHIDVEVGSSETCDA